MKADEDDILLQFPASPGGTVRVAHLPTVEGCIRYWEAVHAQAWKARDFSRSRVAAGLAGSFKARRRALMDAERLGEEGATLSGRAVRVTGEYVTPKGGAPIALEHKR